MARQEPAGLGALPMTQKASPPVGNKKVKVEKMPKKGAAPKAPVDPRDEVMKLVAKKLKQDKTTVGIGSPTPGPTPTPMPTTTMPTPMTTALAAPTAPIMPNDPNNPTPMKEGGTKDKKDAKGLAVVIDMSSQPEYEKASEGTPNDPPPGATSSEVKDDQHVLLSEGELVVPANVVRYHGLGMYEGLRRDALTGLGEMENSGQVEYVSEEVKTAAAGMTILNNQPNVATMGGIKKQQGQYNPALGQYGTATTPAAASAKFVNTTGTFTDTNKDGIDDRLQPSVKPTGLAAPVATSAVTPAALNLGPTSNPNTVVGAGNIGSYVNNQSGIPGSGGDTPPPVVETPQAPLVRRPTQEQDNNDSPGETEAEKAARALANEKINRAKELGHSYNPIKQIAMALLPLSFLGGKQAVGTVTLAGNVVGNDGREYDPLTGKVASSGSMITDVFNKFQGKDISNVGPGGAIIPDTKDPIGTTPMTASGLVQYTIAEMRKAIGDEQVLSQVNAELSNIQKENPNSLVEGAIGTPTGLASLQAPSLKANDINDLMSKITANLESDTNFQAQRDGASAGPLSQEITTPKGGMLSETARANIEADPNYQSSRESFRGLTENALNQILDGTIESTVAQKTAAQDLKEEVLLERISGGTDLAGDAGRQAAKESKFDVEETFGSGRQSQREQANDNFNDNAKSDIESRGGTKSIGLNDNGSFYSNNNDGTFTHENGTTVNFTGSDGKPGNAPETTERQERMEERTARLDAPDDDTASSGESGKIVCTEMYRQTQLDDWTQAMKTWHIYQKKYLTPIHEVGYHSLFKPFVRGMKVNKALTNLGAYLAKERTKHLRHILTKGKSADSIVGNIFCKIIHPIVYLVGLAVHKK